MTPPYHSYLESEGCEATPSPSQTPSYLEARERERERGTSHTVTRFLNCNKTRSCAGSVALSLSLSLSPHRFPVVLSEKQIKPASQAIQNKHLFSFFPIYHFRSWQRCPITTSPVAMAKLHPFLSLFLLILTQFHTSFLDAAGTADKAEEWGYVQVRPSNQSFLVSALTPLLLFSSILFFPKAFILFFNFTKMQKHTCFGGFIGALREVKTLLIHGQRYFGCKAGRYVTLLGWLHLHMK